MKVPDWYGFALLGLASFRVWRLVAEDDILNMPRRWLLRLGNWREDGDKVPDSYRKEWGKWLTCPWCAGFWISALWWAGFQWSPHWSIVVAVPWAISAVVALIATTTTS